MIPNFVKKKFVDELFTIEYVGIVGGEKMNLYSTGGATPTFVNDGSGAKVWKSLRDVKLHANIVNKSALFENNPVVCKYTVHYVGTDRYVEREVLGLLANIIDE